jgi:hypothetical protein
MSLLLNVPYEEKELAKSNGALWNPQLKTWYLPSNRYNLLSTVEQWITEKDFNIVLPEEIILAHTSRKCWSCSQLNTVTAIGANSFYLKDEEDASWKEMDFFTLFESISSVSANLHSFLQDYYPHIKLGYSKTVGDYYWSNHCSSCKKLQGDWFLFNEPGVNFCPVSPENAATITLRNFTFQSAPLINADFSMGDTMDLIIDYAQWGNPIG